MGLTEPTLLERTDWLSAVLDEAALASTAIPAGEAWSDQALTERLRASGIALRARPLDGALASATGTAPELAFVHRLLFQARAAPPPIAPGECDRRLHLSSLCAADAGLFETSTRLQAASRGAVTIDRRTLHRLEGDTGGRLLKRAYLLGNPPGGLPLHALLSAIEVRTFLRIAAFGAPSGGRGWEGARRLRRAASMLKAIAIELTAGLFATPNDGVFGAVRERQVRAAGLHAEDRRRLLESLKRPRAAEELVRLVPRPARPWLLEQVLIAGVSTERWSPDTRRRMAHLSSRAGLDKGWIAATELVAVALALDHAEDARALTADVPDPHWSDPMAGPTETLQALASALAREARETGELGVLLTRLAAGERLSGAERNRMREQLVDLAKVVPSLAILAAPGGTLLLPLLLKWLPFDLRPSAFQGPRGGRTDRSRG